MSVSIFVFQIDVSVKNNRYTLALEGAEIIKIRRIGSPDSVF